MNWNGEKASNYFERLYRSANPNGIKTKQVQNIVTRLLYDVELAKKDLYLRCAENSWSKEKLLDFLSSATIKNISINSKANDPEKYSETYIGFAKEITKKIKDGKIDF
ncbi:MAG: hypothetical protein ACR2J3_08495 [Aridibacter sp.]